MYRHIHMPCIPVFFECQGFRMTMAKTQRNSSVTYLVAICIDYRWYADTMCACKYLFNLKLSIDFYPQAFLEFLCSVCEGKMLSYKDGEQLSRRTFLSVLHVFLCLVTVTLLKFWLQDEYNIVRLLHYWLWEKVTLLTVRKLRYWLWDCYVIDCETVALLLCEKVTLLIVRLLRYWLWDCCVIVVWESYVIDCETVALLCSPKGEAYSHRFVRLSVRPVPCPANNFKTTVGI